MPVPNSFANVTTSIPLSQLDANFNTPITLGNTAIQLGNTVTTLNNMTLANVTVTSGNVTITNVSVTTANVTTANITTAIIATANVATANVTTSQILNYGTANQVQYLNASKALVGSANLTFNGTTLTVANDASVNGLTVGRGAGAVSTNTAVGASALAATTGSSSNNTALGSAAGSSLTSGARNTALGFNALLLNTTGAENTAVGGNALNKSTTASNNTALGYVALYETTTGANNTAVGQGSLQNNTTSSNNTAVGYQAGYSNTTGAELTALGSQAGRSNTTGINNTFLGANAGYTNSTGQFNTYVGNTTGYSTTGSNNTFVGYAAGNAVTSGAKNTVLGAYSGNQGGLDIRTASNYIVLSDGDGNPRVYVNDNGQVFFGVGSNNSDGYLYLQGRAASGYGPILIGRTGAIGSTTDQWLIGSNSNIKGGTTYSTLTCTAGGATGGVNLTSGATSWASASDARLKNVTGTYTNPLADIAQIEAVKFTWKADESAKPCVGVIAQSVEAVVPEAIETVRVSKDDETDYLSVRYTELIPLMIASIQELKAEIDALKGQP